MHNANSVCGVFCSMQISWVKWIKSIVSNLCQKLCKQEEIWNSIENRNVSSIAVSQCLCACIICNFYFASPLLHVFEHTASLFCHAIRFPILLSITHARTRSRQLEFCFRTHFQLSIHITNEFESIFFAANLCQKAIKFNKVVMQNRESVYA